MTDDVLVYLETLFDERAAAALRGSEHNIHETAWRYRAYAYQEAADEVRRLRHQNPAPMLSNTVTPVADVPA